MSRMNPIVEKVDEISTFSTTLLLQHHFDSCNFEVTPDTKPLFDDLGSCPVLVLQSMRVTGFSTYDQSDVLLEAFWEYRAGGNKRVKHWRVGEGNDYCLETIHLRTMQRKVHLHGTVAGVLLGSLNENKACSGDNGI